MNFGTFANCFRAVIAACLLALTTVVAFPPAPHHLIFGQVRDEWGNPLTVENAEVILESASGAKTRSLIVPRLKPGVNYQLEVPMDSGLRNDLYKPTALKPAVPFKIRVRIGQTLFLPIQMVATTAVLGEPGKSTRIDLTLGEDSDGDGLPDAWERALIAQTGGGRGLADVKPGDDSDRDGLSNLEEYTAGTYAFDERNGFSLKIDAIRGQAAVLKFTAVTGRSYSIHASDDLVTWSQISFRMTSDATAGFERSVYSATGVTPVEVEAPLPAGVEGSRYYKLLVE